MQGRILIIEPDNGVLQQLTSELTSAGYTTRGESSATAVFGILETFGPDAIIMEMQHESVSGWLLCNQIKQRAGHAGIVIILLTTLGYEEIAALPCEADAIMAKPYLTANVMLTLKDLLHVGLGALSG